MVLLAVSLSRQVAVETRNRLASRADIVIAMSTLVTNPLKSRTGTRRLRATFGALLTTLALGFGPSTSGTAWADGDPPGAPALTAPLPAESAPSASPLTASLPTAPNPSRTEESLVVRGIYLQQLTVQDPKRLHELIVRAKEVGINTFVVDLWRRSPEYATAVKTIQDAGIHYVPRVTMFPDGARPHQMDDQQLLERRWKVAEYALQLGATNVQLDYIRFSSRNTPSPENAGKVREVLRFFRQRLEQRGARLQIDVFGEVSYGPSIRIGQDMRLFAPELDAVCPMLYPSHFEPYKETAKTPYQTVYGAITALERQTKATPIPIYPFIEHFNYRYRMTEEQRAAYFEAQLQAVLNSGAQGFYVWSVGNYYDIPFNVLERRARERRERGAPIAVAPKAIAREQVTSTVLEQ